MYVVRRSFKCYGKTMLPGSVVEPDSIKRFKTRLKDRFIIEVNAQNFVEWNSYFECKFGVSLQISTKPDKDPEPVINEELGKQVVQTAKVIVNAVTSSIKK